MTDKDHKVVDLKQHRGRVLERRAKQESYKTRAKQGKSSPGSRSDLRWFHYLQFFFILAIIAYGMTICQR